MNKKLAALFVISAGVLWGTISIFINKLRVYGFSSTEISFLRVLTCTVLMLAFLLIYDRKLLKFNIKDIWMFLGTGIVSLTLFSACYFATVVSTEVSVAVSLLYTSPVFLMLFSALLFKEKITVKKVIAIILTVLGCVFISGMVGSGVKFGTMAVLTGIGSGVFYALYSIFGRYATEKYHSLTITFYTFLFASFGLAFLIDTFNTFAMLAEFPKVIPTVIAIGVLCGIMPYILYTVGLKYLDTSVAGVLAAVEPLVGNAVGIALFRESAGVWKIMGIVLILSSVILLSVAPRKHT